MKWGIIILVILGLAAAACAAILVSTFGIKSAVSADKKDIVEGTEVAMAKTSLPAMTVVTLEHIVKEKILKEELPKDERLVSPQGAIGRVLSVPVVEGQILTESCFVASGTGAQLAAALPHGMRAVTVSLSSRAMPDSILLYPGCVVDVLVSFRLSSRESSGSAISTTMLRGIQVLAVSGDSVVSNHDNEKEGGTKKPATSRGRTVTLLVDTKQAEALQLAIGSGDIFLTIRNPLDKELVDLEATILSQGRLANLGSALTPVVPSNDEKSLKLFLEAQQERSSEPNTPEKQSKLLEQYQNRKPPRWGVTVIRGKTAKVEELDIPVDKSTDEAAPKK